MSRALILIPFVLLLAACAADPRDAAQADVMRLRANQDALDRQQARLLSAALAALRAQEEQAISAARIEARAMLWRWAGRAGTVFLLALALGGAWAAVGAGRAASRLVELRARLIPLSGETFQYPLIIQYIGQGRYSLTNPNTGQTLRLDTRNAPDRQLIAAVGATQIAGLLAMRAAKSKDPAGVAIIRPPVIGPKGEWDE